eukprot:3193510-Pleurochrysis_carterae.AAC.1
MKADHVWLTAVHMRNAYIIDVVADDVAGCSRCGHVRVGVNSVAVCADEAIFIGDIACQRWPCVGAHLSCIAAIV